MSKNTLSFLKNDNEELSNISEDIEKIIYSDSNSAIIKARLFAEKMINDVIEKEELNFLLMANQSEKIRYLFKEGCISEDISRAFNNIRLIGNVAVHECKNNDIEYAIKVHKNMYQLACWYVETYGNDCTIKVPEYKLPELPQIDQGINEENIKTMVTDLANKKLNEFMKKFDKEKNVVEKKELELKDDVEIEKEAMRILGYKYEDEFKEETVEEIVTAIDGEEQSTESYIYEKSKGSYLLNELEKLSISSKEAVESSDGLDVFKKYIHVERNIQNELIESIKKAHESNEAQMVLLCGNVGDGKSHLLAYISDIYKEMISDFEIHNDATESFNTNLDEIETLKNVLEPFKDENIEKTNKKLILAINLGVLNNFLEEESVRKNFTKLSEFIKNSGVFEQDVLHGSIPNKNFNLVSFGDYSIFELTEEGPKSNYIKGILDKIVAKDSNNIFFNAFNKDIENGLESPILENYKILSIPGVTERISKLIISVIVKYKKIIATREILNFIYELLVPTNLEKFDMSSTALDYNKVLLPNILFETKEMSDLLKEISKEDPLKYRDKKLDDLLIMLNISSDLNGVVSKYLDAFTIEPLEEMLEFVKSFNNEYINSRQEITGTIIRSLYLVGNEEIQGVFEEQAYINYMRYLYFYNKGDLEKYIDMFDEVKRAVFNWNGSPKDNYIYLNDNLKNYRIAEKLEFEETQGKGVCEKIEFKEIERFKSNIKLDFEMITTEENESIEIDYQLYKKIVDVNKGYCPNKSDKEEAIRFVEFIEKIIAHGDMEKELLIENTDINQIFTLKYKKMRDRFEFRREQ